MMDAATTTTIDHEFRGSVRKIITDLLQTAAVFVCIAFAAVAFTRIQVEVGNSSTEGNRHLLTSDHCIGLKMLKSAGELNAYMRDTGSGDCCREDGQGGHFFIHFERYGLVQKSSRVVEAPPNYSAVGAYNWISKATSSSSLYTKSQRESIQQMLTDSLPQGVLTNIMKQVATPASAPPAATMIATDDDTTTENAVQ
jgi:hypothetical protein